ncbi:Uncharacterised protein [Salmonella enterica subsp. enterica serovar Bovismorbificans]|uniref:Uncharacterized protein n=1 Tax=Salmonella enterica subsp. enterica serovar Bovismorbificans TaxID=58097 RepID=A0A655DT30_SALET|nr:Uncharacterised protein [Salmonella enterica subsp. enterica serovar Bovismorbificans]CNU85672.1 Uncharacterised protein [Salmonella enterica subsp. enterica serovar Bovismorbificans]CNV24527.1 Uncharacterised protein [Salmonella enterica subsp. enterica serovar Bovismorbificans]CPR45985.1 Uncharacterised protein [Salmonella enterica subsp. enterica serovar Bovismorbificans]CPR69662.1 Uncharacterised protein [Salmonella enterica subsp. enterica serovar Bovismorbificans]
MTQRDMAHFMTDHGFNFVVGHHIHQSAVDADTTVRHGKRVDVFRLVNLIVHRLAVNVIPQRGGNFCQSFSVFAARRRDFRFAVELLTGLIAQRFYLRIA